MKISIRFNLVKGGAATDLPIRMRVSYDGMRLDLRTGYVCHPDKWDTRSMRMRPGTSNRYGEKASAINAALSRMEVALSGILNHYDLEGNVPMPSVLKSDFERVMGRTPKGGSTPSSTLMDLVHRFISEYAVQSAWSGRTAASYATALERLEDFPFASNPPDALTEADLSGYISELWGEGLENQTVSLYLSKLKTALRWGRKVGLYHGSLPETFTPKLKGLGSKVVNYLEWDEFKQLLYLPVTNPSHAAIRDAFCFCCASGLRVSDCSALTWAQVSLSSEHPHISISARKTTKPLVIELNQFSRALIDRQLQGGSSDTVFPSVPVRTRNYVLPILAKEAGLTRLVREVSFTGNQARESLIPIHAAISTHWGRHTFIVHALRLGIPPTVIMSWTGHASMASMKPYIAIADEAKVENMAKFDED